MQQNEEQESSDEELEDQPEQQNEVVPKQNTLYTQELIDKLNKPHQFWSTQPMPNINEMDKYQPGPIQPGVLAEVRKDPFNLIDKFEWFNVDLTNDEQAQEVYIFLKNNYVEDNDQMFRFEYSIESLKWALLPPGQYADWLVGVRVNQKLVGFITGIPVTLHIENEQNKVKMAAIDFLCVHKKIRSNRLAPVLIKEITRRVNIKNMWQLVYTGGVVLPTPISQPKYYHRDLNVRKLIEVEFSNLSAKETITQKQILYNLPENPQTPGVRPMKNKDVAQITKLLNEYLKNFELYFIYTEEEVNHWFMPRKDVISTYVVENEQGLVTDFLSFYNLPSQVLNNPNYTHLRAAYSYYNVATQTPIVQLMYDALILAKNEGYDVFNALPIMDNEKFLKETFFKIIVILIYIYNNNYYNQQYSWQREYVIKIKVYKFYKWPLQLYQYSQELRFCQGDGELNYYLYNWKLEKGMLKPEEIGIVLI